MNSDELETLHQDLKWKSWNLLLNTIRKEVADDVMIGRLRSRFESVFRYDETGVPRLWKLEDPIDSIFKTSMDGAENMIALFSKMNIPLSSIGSDITDDEVFWLHACIDGIIENSK